MLEYLGHKAIMPQPHDPRHNLRLPPELKKKLLHSAVDNGRSMNAEILVRLEKSFDAPSCNGIEAILGSMLILGEEDRAKVAALLSEATSILSKR